MSSVLQSPKVRELLERAGLGGLSPATVKAALALAVVVVGFGLWRFWPRAPAPELQVAGTQEVAESSAASEEATGEIVVHVAGAVLRPGVYHLPTGSRVDDAVQAAGGALGNAALEALNLARVLADGEQVYVQTADQLAAGAPALPSAPAGASAAEGVVNINTASAGELEALPGVGPSTAQKIVDDRETNGPFSKPEDLMRVPGIGPKKFDALRDFVVCG